jgi:flagellar hook-basal body complex protein FliE
MAMLPVSGVGGSIDAISFYRSAVPIGSTGSIGGAAAAGPQSFAEMISSQLSGAVDLQAQGAQASQALATGTASDVSAATISVEKAAVSLQLVGAFRNKAVEAYQDVMRMQI